jgi:hypothetical protein
MNIESWAAVAGIGGLALGAATLVFRDIIARDIFSGLPAALTYKLLRLIVLCAFILGLIGTVGWIWLQSSVHARAEAKAEFEDSLARTRAQLNYLQSYNRAFALVSFDNYNRKQDAGSWAAVQTDLTRTWNNIERAKAAITKYNALTPNPIDLSEINSLLVERHGLIAVYVLNGPTVLPGREEFRQLYRDYSQSVADFAEALSRIQSQLGKS